jgi:SAM-dependent methyltransferase
VSEPVTESAAYGQLGISEPLRRFTEEFRYERGPILEFIIDVAAATPADARVLDVGSGNAPYRELFAHTRYTTNDWSDSLHADASRADIIASADALPVHDDSFDLVVCTQVLEHVPEPLAVLQELARVLVSGGRLALTVPLLWELHEAPHDYYRYTEPGVRHLLAKAGFGDCRVWPRGDGFTAIAQLMHNLGWAMGDADDGLTAARIEARQTLNRVADELARLAPLDVNHVMPLGYCAIATKPEA